MEDKTIQRFDSRILKHIVFDVDGTLYTKDFEYSPGNGSIQTAHDFFRFLAFQRLKNGNKSPFEISQSLIKEYQLNTKNNNLKEIVKSIPQDLKNDYESLVKKYGSNGKVFVGELRVDSGYLHQMLSFIDFGAILAPDTKLKQLIKKLDKNGYDLGILTTEVYSTIEKVFNSLGINLNDFVMPTGDKYKILCSENVKQKKPSPEGFERLKEIYGADNPREIVYVGDVLEKDIEPSLKSGLQAVHVSSSEPRVTFQVADIDTCKKEYAKVNSIYDLEELLCL